jgi:hypothetical protein
MNIQEIIQEMVDHEAKVWSEDTTPPIFIVSIFENSLILTCKHIGCAFSTKLFPAKDMTYGLEQLSKIMEGLYNRTM